MLAEPYSTPMWSRIDTTVAENPHCGKVGVPFHEEEHRVGVDQPLDAGVDVLAHEKRLFWRYWDLLPIS